MAEGTAFDEAEGRVLTLIFTAHALLLAKQRYPTWRAIQDEFFDYQASLGPFTADELFDYLRADYRTTPPFDRADVERFLLAKGARLMSGNAPPG